MFTIAKIIDTNPNRRTFLTTNLFVFDERTKILAVIMILVDRKEIFSVALQGCAPGPNMFQEALSEIQKGQNDVPDQTRLIYKEHIRDINEVEDFAIDHLRPYVEDTIAVMGTHEDVAEILRRCFKVST